MQENINQPHPNHIFSSLHLKKSESRCLNSIPSKPFLFEKKLDSQHFHRQISILANWNNLQKAKHLIFVCYFRQFLKKEKLNWNLFKGMSDFIQTRSPQQCRSHHLKMLANFSSVEKFIQKAIKKFPKIYQKIIEVLDRLIELQEEYNVFEIKVKKEQNLQFINNSYLNEKSMKMPVDCNQKDAKIEMLKTSDDYHEEDLIKLNEKKFGISSRKNQFNQLFPIKSRQSMPSFLDQSQSLQQEKEEKVRPDLIKFQESEKQKQVSQLKPEMVEESQEWKNNCQRMKDIYQCQYLFQLWSKKLQQIMSGSSIYEMENWNKK